VKRKKISALLGIALTIAVLAGAMVPIANASPSMEIEFVNPLADVEPINNLPLAERTGWTFDAEGNPDFNGKVVGLAWYTKNVNSHALAAIAMKLKNEYPDVIIAASGNVGSIFTNTALTATTNPFPANTALVGKRLRNNSGTFANLANPWNAKTDANYNLWGGVSTLAYQLTSATTTTNLRLDAVILGVAD